jgi:hypothetical protein
MSYIFYKAVFIYIKNVSLFKGGSNLGFDWIFKKIQLFIWHPVVVWTKLKTKFKTSSLETLEHDLWLEPKLA